MELEGTRREKISYQWSTLTTESRKGPRLAPSSSFLGLSVCLLKFLQGFPEVSKTLDCIPKGRWPRICGQKKRAKEDGGIRLSGVAVTFSIEKACPLSLSFKPPKIPLADSLGIWCYKGSTRISVIREPIQVPSTHPGTASPQQGLFSLQPPRVPSLFLQSRQGPPQPRRLPRSGRLEKKQTVCAWVESLRGLQLRDTPSPARTCPHPDATNTCPHHLWAARCSVVRFHSQLCKWWRYSGFPDEEMGSAMP